MLDATVIGAGLIGARRALALAALPDARVVQIVDPNASLGQEVARRVAAAQAMPCAWAPTWQGWPSDDARALRLGSVAVPHDLAAEYALALLGQGIHALLEKPMGLDLHQARALHAAAERGPARLAIGFNYRQYPAVAEAARLAQDGELGRLMNVRLVLGHGGRPEFPTEWKASRARAGGGALIDPGIHLLDLARWLAGPLRPISAHLATTFWPIDVEDLATAVLETETGAVVQVHSSLVEWRNLFTLHVFGENGYARVEGRQGNYGEQVLSIGHRWGWQSGVSQADSETVRRYGSEDRSFEVETAAVVDALRSGQPLPTDHRDGLAAMELVSALYELARSRPT